MANFSESVAPEQAIERLVQGNARFVEREHDLVNAGWRPGLSQGQKPFAIILGCSDARSPAELVFDQGLGDLFVIRVAGNIVAPSGIGSVEYAVSQFGTRLVVVMGHTHCGAVRATLNGIQGGDSSDSRHVRSITDRIRPHVQELALAGLTDDALMKAAVRANVRACVAHLRNGSQLIEDYVRPGSVVVAGAVYDLDTGRVEFIELPPKQTSPSGP
ncbi:MAG: carbonic anhydrase [Myxococcaceae bacterium]